MGISASGNKVKLSVQGYISSGSDNFGSKVFNKTEFDVVAPVPIELTSKTCTVYPGDPSALDSAEISISEPDDVIKAQTNAALALNTGVPEPLAVYSFKKQDLENLFAAAYQSMLEDKCSIEFSNQMMTLLEKSNPGITTSIKSSLGIEIENAQLIVDAIFQAATKIRKFDDSLSTMDQDKISSLAINILKSLSPDPIIGPGGAVVGLNLQEFFTNITIPTFSESSAASAATAAGGSGTISEKTNTALVNQLLSTAAESISRGATNISKGEPIYKINAGPDAVSTSMFAQGAKKITLKSLSLSTQLEDSFVYGIEGLESKSYIDKVYNTTPVSPLDSTSGVKFVGHLCALVANEFALSSGLGRLEGTPLGISFGSTGDYIKNLFGATNNNALSETTNPGSLSDFFVVDLDGNSNLQNTNSQGVLILEGTKFKSTPTRKNCVDAFTGGILRYPTNSQKNKISSLDKSLTGAQKRFESGVEFYKKLHLRDKNLSLLTPRGLFSRLIRDFSNSLTYLSSGGSSLVQVQTQREIALLGNNENKFQQKGSDTNPSCVIKQFILSLLVKKAMIKIYGGSDVSSKTTDSESQKNEAAGPTSDAENKLQNDLKVEKLVNSSAVPRFSFNDVKIFNSRFDGSVPIEVLDAILQTPHGTYVLDQPNLVTVNGTVVEAEDNIKFTLAEFCETFLKIDDTFLGKIVQIYADLCNESLVMSRSENASANYLNSLRLTKNSQIDSAILLSLLLDAASLLCKNFSFSKRVDAKPEFIVEYTASGQQKYVWPTIQVAYFLEIGVNTQTQTGQKALSLISEASLSNNLNSLIVYPENGSSSYIPGLNGASPSIVIGSGQQSSIQFLSLFELLKNLAKERDLPATALSVAKAAVDYAKESASGLIKFGNQLLGNESRDNQTIVMADFANTSIGASYLASVNQYTVDLSQEILDDLKKSLTSLSGKNLKMSIGEYNCLKVVIDDLINTQTSYESASSSDDIIFLTTAFPIDFVKNSIDSSLSFEKESKLQNPEIFSLYIQKSLVFKSDPNDTGANIDRKFLIRRVVTEESFSSFEGTNTPKSMKDVITFVKIKGAGTGGDFVNTKVSKDSAFDILRNEIGSHLLKKLFSTLSSVDLFEKNIVISEQLARSEGSLVLARALANIYKIPEATFDSVFVKKKYGNDTYTVLDKQALFALTTPTFSNTKNTAVVSPALLTFGEAEFFYDIFSSIYFMQGMILQKVFVPFAVERVVGTLYSEKSFFGSTESSISTFNTYNVSAAKLSPPLLSINT